MTRCTFRVTAPALFFASSFGVLDTSAQVGRAVSPDGPDIVVSFTADPDYTISGDMFGVRSRLAPGTPDIPDVILDDSLSLDPGDNRGIIGKGDNGVFFGVVDTVNSTGENTNTATWTFDIADFINLAFSIDFAAMGDFENADTHVFIASIDGAEPVTLYESTVDDAGDADYTLDGGDTFNLDDPMSMNGTELSNDFVSLIAPVTGAGSTLALTYTGETNGGTEAFAFRNIQLTGDQVAGDVLGDYDGSGQVEQGDLDIVLQNWGTGTFTGDENALVGGGPFDGNVDQNELDGVLQNWGAGSAPDFTGSAVPEPTVAGVALLGWGLLSRPTRGQRDQ